MKQLLKRYGKIIVFDFLATLCFIGVVLFGWLPGPGGIPLFLLGLSLLAVNHDWAERWLETAKHHGVTFKKWLFPNKRWVRNLYDFGAVILVSLGGFMLFRYDQVFYAEDPSFGSTVLATGSIVLICFSLFVFLMNRDRFDKFATLFKRKRL